MFTAIDRVASKPGAGHQPEKEIEGNRGFEGILLAQERRYKNRGL